MRYSMTIREYLTIPLRFRIKWYLLPPDWHKMKEYEVKDD